MENATYKNNLSYFKEFANASWKSQNTNNFSIGSPFWRTTPMPSWDLPP